MAEARILIDPNPRAEARGNSATLFPNSLYRRGLLMPKLDISKRNTEQSQLRYHEHRSTCSRFPNFSKRKIDPYCSPYPMIANNDGYLLFLPGQKQQR